MSDEKAVALWALLVVMTGGGIILVSALLGPRRRRGAKLAPYECGVPLFQDARDRFPVRFYLMAIVFILFDIEIVYLYPLAVQLEALGWFGLGELLTFVGILGVAYVYVWRKGALNWH